MVIWNAFQFLESKIIVFCVSSSSTARFLGSASIIMMKHRSLSGGSMPLGAAFSTKVCNFLKTKTILKEKAKMCWVQNLLQSPNYETVTSSLSLFELFVCQIIKSFLSHGKNQVWSQWCALLIIYLAWPQDKTLQIMDRKINPFLSFNIFNCGEFIEAMNLFC